MSQNKSINNFIMKPANRYLVMEAFRNYLIENYRDQIENLELNDSVSNSSKSNNSHSNSSIKSDHSEQISEKDEEESK